MRLREGIVAMAILLAACCAAGAQSTPRPNLLRNGDFAHGSGNSPDFWRSEAWISDPAAVEYRWLPPGNGPGTLEVNNLKPNDARWTQSLALPPGWYYISADVKAEKVPADKTGANISLLEDGVMSRDLHGTTDWQRVGFHLKVGGHGADVEVALRVGGFSNLNGGIGYFRNARVERIDQPAANATPVFDLETIRKAAQPVPIGQPWTLVATFALLGVVAFLGWRAWTEATLGVSADTPPETKPTTKPEPKGRPKKRRAHG